MSWRTGVTRAFHSLWKLAYTPWLVLWCLWRSRTIIPDLSRLFWEPAMVLVKDCEVKTCPFTSAVSSSWPFPSWGVFAEKPWRAPEGGSLGCCWVLWPSVTSFKAAGSSKSSGHQGSFLSPDAPTHPWCSDLLQGNWVTQSNGKDIVTVFPRGLALILCVCKAP